MSREQEKKTPFIYIKKTSSSNRIFHRPKYPRNAAKFMAHLQNIVVLQPWFIGSPEGRGLRTTFIRHLRLTGKETWLCLGCKDVETPWYVGLTCMSLTSMATISLSSATRGQEFGEGRNFVNLMRFSVNTRVTDERIWLGYQKKNNGICVWTLHSGRL